MSAADVTDELSGCTGLSVGERSGKLFDKFCGDGSLIGEALSGEGDRLVWENFMGWCLIEHDSTSFRQFSSFAWLQSLWICSSKRAI